MAREEIRFDDGEAYEDFMGKWSLLAGEAFLDWLGASRGLRWAEWGRHSRRRGISTCNWRMRVRATLCGVHSARPRWRMHFEPMVMR